MVGWRRSIWSRISSTTGQWRSRFCARNAQLRWVQKDRDVPITQAEEMFIALKKLGVEPVLARYPGEGPGFRRSEHWQDASKRISDWFVEYLEPGKVVRLQ